MFALAKVFSDFSSKAAPYLRLIRLHKPLPVLLLLFPCLFVIASSASGGSASFGLLLKVLLGALVARSFGCVINDIIDVEIDKQVERTKARPLASGELSIKEAMYFLIFLLAVGLCLLLTMKASAILAGLLLFIMVVLYPLAKRFIPIPQVFLGFVFPGGALICAAEMHDRIDLNSLLIYFGCVSWVIAYDTVYAMQDVECDRVVGVKSSVVFFKKPLAAVSALYDASSLLWLSSSIVYNTMSRHFLIFLLLGWAIFRFQIRHLSRPGVKVTSEIAFFPNVLVAAIMTVAFWVAPLPIVNSRVSDSADVFTERDKNLSTEASDLAGVEGDSLSGLFN